MNKISRYKAISRVVKDKEVIGFMMLPMDKKVKKEIYMPLDVISFGLKEKNFEILNVKLGANGKPRGYNGFYLSKLPVNELIENESIDKGLIEVLMYILKGFSSDFEVLSSYKKYIDGIVVSYVLVFEYPPFKELSLDIAKKELNSLLLFYVKSLPEILKLNYDDIIGYIDKNKNVNIKVSKTLVKVGE